jgi:DNA-binding response OmpR family regulator
MQPRLRRRVLVIEDDPDVRKLISDSLRDSGLDVVAAVDGAHALRSALAARPAAVVLDLGLPEMDGVDFVTRWRERAPRASEIPIVVVSGRKDAQQLAALIGATKLFVKPFEVEELVGEVGRALN